MLTFWIFGYLCTNDDMESKVCDFLHNATRSQKLFEVVYSQDTLSKSKVLCTV